MANTTIAEGGVLPYINPTLLPSKSKSAEEKGISSGNAWFKLFIDFCIF